jgi:RNA polymerase sigma-70 factor (ECF subfamily)
VVACLSIPIPVNSRGPNLAPLKLNLVARNTSLVSDTDLSTAAPDVDRLIAGDAHEFEKLVVRESGRLYRIIRRIVRDDDEARSVMQEAFLQAYQRRETFRRESMFTTWLYGIGINLARVSARKSARTSVFSEEQLLQLQQPLAATASTSSEWNPAKMAESAERQRIVRNAISRLPEDYRIVVSLRDIEELSTDEVAQILGVTEGAVRVRLHRARKALKEMLTSYFSDPD